MAIFGPKRRISTRPKKQCKIMKMSRKQLVVTQSNLRPLNWNGRVDVVFKNKARCTMKTQGQSSNSPLATQCLQRNKSIGQLNVKIVDNLAISKSSRKSIDILVAKPMNKNQSTSQSLETSKADEKARSKELLASKKDVPTTHLKAMVGLAHKARSVKRPTSDQGQDTIAREARAKKLKSKSIELSTILDSPNTTMISIPNNGHSNEGKGKDINHIGEGHAVCDKLEDIQKAKQSPSLTLPLSRGSHHMQDLENNSRNNSSRCKSDKALRMEDDHSMGVNHRESNKRKELLLEENHDTNEANDVPKENTTGGLMKKDRATRGTNKDDYEAHDIDNNSVGVKEHVGKRISHSAISNYGHKEPLCVDEQRCQCCSKPIDKPTWRGILKMDDKKYAFLVGHLSSKSSEKVWSLSQQLRPLVEVKKLPRSMVWPKAWEASKPNGDNIGLYFLPHNMREDKDLNQLLKEVVENDLALQAIVGEAEMLIFPSSLLPYRHQTFQGKHYLWGIFKPRKDKAAVGAEPLNGGRHAQEVEKETQQHVSDQQDETESLCYGSVHSAEASPDATATIAANDNGQTDATTVTEPPTGRLVSLVVQQTAEVEQFIREMERTGKLVFAVQGKRINAGSWSGNMAATAVQK